MGRRRGTSAFPVARIKKMMQSDDDVGKIATVTPVLVAKALECMMEDVLKDAAHTALQRQTRTVTPQHLKHAVSANDQFDFLRGTLEAVPALDEENTVQARTPPLRAPRVKRPRSPFRAEHQVDDPDTSPAPAKTPSGRPRRQPSQKSEPVQPQLGKVGPVGAASPSSRDKRYSSSSPRGSAAPSVCADKQTESGLATSGTLASSDWNGNLAGGGSESAPQADDEEYDEESECDEDHARPKSSDTVRGNSARAPPVSAKGGGGGTSMLPEPMSDATFGIASDLGTDVHSSTANPDFPSKTDLRISPGKVFDTGTVLPPMELVHQSVAETQSSVSPAQPERNGCERVSVHALLS